MLQRYPVGIIEALCEGIVQRRINDEHEGGREGRRNKEV
jgi:hypothetical protein